MLPKSYSLDVARVVSQHPVELSVVDLVRCLRLETFIYQLELLFARLQLHVVENRSESCHVDESRSRLVFVLEERLNQKSVVSHMCAQSLQQAVQSTLFVLI